MQHSKTLYEKGILKNRNMLTQSQYADFKFVARLDDLKPFYSGIKALNFNESGAFHINGDGVRITVEHGKSTQASLFLTANYFEEYHVNDFATFGLNMNVIAECLGIFHGIDCSMKIFYKGDGAALILVLEPRDEDNLTTECAIKTTHYEEPIEFSLDEDANRHNVVFLRGPDAADPFNYLYQLGQDLLEINLSPQEPHFEIIAMGDVQPLASVQIPKTSDEIILFKCREKTSAQYRLAQMRLIRPALAVANKVALKTDASGLLEMHFMLQSKNQSEVYLQYFIPPQADID